MEEETNTATTTRGPQEITGAMAMATIQGTTTTVADTNQDITRKAHQDILLEEEGTMMIAMPMVHGMNGTEGMSERTFRNIYNSWTEGMRWIRWSTHLKLVSMYRIYSGKWRRTYYFAA